MELSIRLAQIMEEHSDAGRGAIKRICEATGLERHAVSALFHNEVKYVSLKSLGSICDFLIEHLNVDPSLLPGILFGHEPTLFWERLAERDRLEISVGARGNGEEQQVMSSDLHLQGQVVRRVMEARRVAGAPALRPLVQTLVTAPPRADDENRAETEKVSRAEAERSYRDFRESRSPNGALICLGSVKSNPLVELLISNAFDLTAFEPETGVADEERKCPCYVRFRDGDVHPPSSFGGVDAPGLPANSGVSSGTPGIYYMKEPGVWACAPFDERHDAALVFWVYHPNTGRIEMNMGGFTLRATDWLVTRLPMFNDEAFEPPIEGGGYVASMVVIRFSLAEGDSDPQTEAVALRKDVLEPRLAC